MNLFGNNNNIINNIQNLNKINNMKINNNNYLNNCMNNNVFNNMNNLNLNNNYNAINNNSMNKINNLTNFNYMNNNSLNKAINNNNIIAFLDKMNAQKNQEEFCITRKFKENTPEGVKIYKIKYSSSLIKNNNGENDK